MPVQDPELLRKAIRALDESETIGQEAAAKARDILLMARKWLSLKKGASDAVDVKVFDRRFGELLAATKTSLGMVTAEEKALLRLFFDGLFG